MNKIILKYEAKLAHLNEVVKQTKHLTDADTLDMMNNMKILLTEVVTDIRSLSRTEAEIDKEINRLINNDSNFISDNYGSEAADNGEYEIYFSKYSTKETLRRFAKWLLGNNA